MTAAQTVIPPGEEAVRTAGTVVRHSRWLAGSSVLVGLANYAYSLAMTRLLAPDLFADFGAAQSLLLICGTLATSSVPWVVARVLAEAGHHEDQRRLVVWFSVMVNLAQGLLAAAVVCLLGARFLSTASLLALAAGSVAIFLTTTPGGWLQGSGRLGRLAFFRVLEVLVKVVVGVALVLAGGGEAGALAGVGAGALAVVMVGMLLMQQDIRYTPGALRVRSLWQASVGNVGVQGLVAVLASTDVVLVAVLDGGSQASGSYQASTILARVPVFLAGALGVAAFPTLVGKASVATAVRSTAMASFGWLAGAYAIALVTAPVLLVELVFPASYTKVQDLLAWTAVSGLLIGTVNLVTTFFQAAATYATAVRVLVVAVLLHAAALFGGWWVADVEGVAIVSPVVPALVVAVLLTKPQARLSSWHHAVRPAGLLGLAATVLVLSRPVWPLWLAVAAAIGGLAVRRALVTSTSHGASGMRGGD